MVDYEYEGEGVYGWIQEDGTFIDTGYGGHEEWVYHNYEPQGDEQVMGQYELIREIEKRWVRISMTIQCYCFKPNDAQLKTLRQMVDTKRIPLYRLKDIEL